MIEKVQQDYYTILGITRFASQEEIDDAYRELVLELHPDIQHKDEEPSDEFLAIQEAYDVLSDPKKRKAYNSTIISFTTTRDVGKRDLTLNQVPKLNDPGSSLLAVEFLKIAWLLTGLYFVLLIVFSSCGSWR